MKDDTVNLTRGEEGGGGRGEECWCRVRRRERNSNCTTSGNQGSYREQLTMSRKPIFEI